jgi:ABC-type spermidine/putrescine transport system permease subunit II
LLLLIVPVIVYSIAVYGPSRRPSDRRVAGHRAGHAVHAIPFVVIIVSAALRLRHR